jgi:hypothetical protein
VKDARVQSPFAPFKDSHCPPLSTDTAVGKSSLCTGAPVAASIPAKQKEAADKPANCKNRLLSIPEDVLDQ